jgi:RNA polymerase sigma-70 factor, ECF subfamily
MLSDTELTQLYGLALSKARHMTRNASDAEDIAHDCLLKALEWRPLASTSVNWRAWLSTAIRRRAIDVMRRAACAQRTLAQYDSELSLPAPEVSQHPETDPSCVRTALGDMSDGSRRVLELYYFERLSCRDIGTRLQVPSNTVAMRLHRARKHLLLKIEALDPRDSTV